MKSSDVFIEKELVLMGKVPTERLFSVLSLTRYPQLFLIHPRGIWKIFLKHLV